MPVSFEAIRVGTEYERPFLANLWGYQGHQAIARGVVTPADSHVIVLFVTHEKQASLTQYTDYMCPCGRRADSPRDRCHGLPLTAQLRPGSASVSRRAAPLPRLDRRDGPAARSGNGA